MDESMMLVLYLTVVFVAIILSLKMDKRLKSSNPEASPYAFGYFLGFFGVLILPAILIQHFYLPTSGIIEVNLPLDIAFALVSAGILYRRSLAWLVMIVGNLFFIIPPSVMPVMKNPMGPLENIFGKSMHFDETHVMVISLIILLVITIYFLKRRQEMPLI